MKKNELNNFDESCQRAKIKGNRAELLKASPKSLKFRKGLSNEVFFSYKAVEYLSGNEYPCGYFGACGRTPWKDKIVESLLREQGLGDEGIACWLSSGSARHLMDDGEYINIPTKFKKHVAGYVSGAFMDVLVWSHPDHNGFLDSSIRLRAAVMAISKKGEIK